MKKIMMILCTIMMVVSCLSFNALACDDGSYEGRSGSCYYESFSYSDTVYIHASQGSRGSTNDGRLTGGYITFAKHVDVAGNVDRLGADALKGYNNIQSITLHEGLKEIGANAFAGTSTFM